MPTRRFLVLSILIQLLFLSSCKKDEVPENSGQLPIDTIYPKTYMPYYPNSWWRYLDQNGDTIIKRTSSSYILHSYTIQPYYITNNNDPYYFVAYAPEYEGEPYYGYSTVTNYTGPSYLLPVFSETSGELNIPHSTSSNGGGYYQHNITTNHSCTVNSITYNNVIQDTRFFIYNHTGGGPYLGTYFYAPDVGLIEYNFDLIPSDTIPPIESLHLIDYHIGPH